MPSSAPRAEVNSRNARFYPPPPGAPKGDRLLNASAVCVIFQVHIRTFMGRQQDGWPSLDGEKLASYKRSWRRAGRGGIESTYLESEVRAALKPYVGEVEVYTVAEIEKSGEWVCTNHSGVDRGTLRQWRSLGQLTEGEDYDRKFVRVPHRYGHQVHRRVFYRRTAIARMAQLEGAETDRWKDTETIEREGKKLLRFLPASRYLKVNESTLRKWTDDGCPYLEGRCLNVYAEDVAGVSTRYWYQDELETVKHSRNALPRTAASGETYSLEQAKRLTGLDIGALRNEKKCQQLGLERVVVSVRVVCERTTEKGKAKWHSITRQIAFTKESVKEFVKNNAVPRNCTTALKAAKTLKVNLETVNSWCNEGILKAKRGTTRDKWLISKRSVRAMKVALRAARKKYKGKIAVRLASASRREQIAQEKGESVPDPLAIPPGKMTTAEAMSILDLSRSAVNHLCDKNLLDGQRQKYQTAAGPRQGWLITRESVEAAKELLRDAPRGTNFSPLDYLEAKRDARKEASPRAEVDPAGKPLEMAGAASVREPVERMEEGELSRRAPDPRVQLSGITPECALQFRDLLNPPQQAAPPQYVNLDRAAALVHKSKKTLERYKNEQDSDMPEPAVEGGGGKAAEWEWGTLRPWLEKTFNRKLPERFPQMSAVVP